MNAIAAFFIADALLGRPADAAPRTTDRPRTAAPAGPSTGLRDRLRALIGAPPGRPAATTSGSSSMRFVRASSEWRETVRTYISGSSIG